MAALTWFKPEVIELDVPHVEQPGRDVSVALAEGFVHVRSGRTGEVRVWPASRLVTLRYVESGPPVRR